MLERLADPNVWIAFATLTVMEIVLGIDNIVFISVLVSRLPKEQADRARKLGLGDRVRFRGSIPQDRLFRMYDEFDLFAFPTEPREPFGFAPLEAAARGCVPLMTQVCGIGEWLVHGDGSAVNWEHGHAKGQVAVRGAAVHLLLAVLRRIPADDDRLQIIGESEIWETWLERTEF